MKRLLMIAYHFPPIQGSSGVHRTVQFARHLPKFGWEPMVVSVHPRAYPAIGKDWRGGLPEDVTVRRAFALDSARHLSVKGRYLGISAVPDRWMTWWPSGVLECLKLIRQFKPAAIWSTFPVATAHLIGMTVHKLTGLPWIADFRDPMMAGNAPGSWAGNAVYRYLEEKAIAHAACCVLVTESAAADYRCRYPGNPESFWKVIENGYDETPFGTHQNESGRTKPKDRPFRIVHSGILYAEGRNPTPFLMALRSFIEKSASNIEVVFRGCGNELGLQERIADLGLESVVKIAPQIPYDAAIQEMLQADALAVFQGNNFKNQIPAKAYEYIRSGRPILALTDEHGETAKFLRNWDGVYFGDMESPESIEFALSRLLADCCENKNPSRPPEKVLALSRESTTKVLAEILNSLQ